MIRGHVFLTFKTKEDDHHTIKIIFVFLKLLSHFLFLLLILFIIQSFLLYALLNFYIFLLSIIILSVYFLIFSYEIHLIIVRNIFYLSFYSQSQKTNILESRFSITSVILFYRYFTYALFFLT